MLEELRRNNSIGNSVGIDTILSLIFNEKILSIEAINNSCRYLSPYQLNSHLAILLFEELKLIEVSGDNVYLTESGNKLCSLSIPQIKNYLSELIINKLLSEKLISCTNIVVDSTHGELKIPINAFSLSVAILRNFLFEINCLVKIGSYLIVANTNIRNNFEEKIAQEKRKLSQEDLLMKLKNQQEDGDKGEIFVVNFEKTRLNGYGLSPKRVSLIDIGAGYDILSCQNSSSNYYDRYIEVKSFRGTPHFYWSSNEKAVATALEYSYYLYLVDLNKMEKSPNTYIPQIICNPAKELLNDEWLIEPDSYRITHVK